MVIRASSRIFDMKYSYKLTKGQSVIAMTSQRAYDLYI